MNGVRWVEYAQSEDLTLTEQTRKMLRAGGRIAAWCRAIGWPVTATPEVLASVLSTNSVVGVVYSRPEGQATVRARIGHNVLPNDASRRRQFVHDLAGFVVMYQLVRLAWLFGEKKNAETGDVMTEISTRAGLPRLV